jgi:hypothetical protein
MATNTPYVGIVYLQLSANGSMLISLAPEDTASWPSGQLLGVSAATVAEFQAAVQQAIADSSAYKG